MKTQGEAVNWGGRSGIFLFVFLIKDKVAGRKIGGETSNPSRRIDVPAFGRFPKEHFGSLSKSGIGWA